MQTVNWWFAYDVIKNMTMPIMISFTPNFHITSKTIQHVSTKFKVTSANQNRVMGQIIWRIFYYVIWENGLVDILLPTNMAATI